MGPMIPFPRLRRWTDGALLAGPVALGTPKSAAGQPRRPQLRGWPGSAHAGCVNQPPPTHPPPQHGPFPSLQLWGGGALGVSMGATNATCAAARPTGALGRAGTPDDPVVTCTNRWIWGVSGCAGMQWQRAHKPLEMPPMQSARQPASAALHSARPRPVLTRRFGNWGRVAGVAGAVCARAGAARFPTF